jgi:hypothetical protein
LGRLAVPAAVLLSQYPADMVSVHAEIFAFTASWRYFVSIGRI